MESICALTVKLLGESEFGRRMDAQREWARTTDVLPNLWLGVSAEDQKTADERIPWLLKTPAAVRWASYEPALGPVDFGEALGRKHGADYHDKNGPCTCGDVRLDWIVVGGESGPGARPFDIQWARDTIAQCEASGVPCFVKQLGRVPMMHEEDWRQLDRVPLLSSNNCKRVPDGMVPLAFEDKKGGDISEWDEALRVREYPHV